MRDNDYDRIELRERCVNTAVELWSDMEMTVKRCIDVGSMDSDDESALTGYGVLIVKLDDTSAAIKYDIPGDIEFGWSVGSLDDVADGLEFVAQWAIKKGQKIEGVTY